MFPLVLVLFVSLPCFAQDGLPGQGLRFRDLNSVPGFFPRAINDQGVVLGDVFGTGAVLVAPDGTVRTLANSGTAVALNNRGQVVLQNGVEVFLVQPDGSMETRTYPGADRVSAYGLNNSGQVVGVAGSAVVWDEAGTATTFRVPLSRLNPGSGNAMSINDAGEIAGAYAEGSGPYGVYRRSPDGFFRDVGRAARFPQMGMSNDGTLFFTHQNPPNSLYTEIRSSTDAVVYAASDSYLMPKGSMPLFSGMSANGRLLVGRYAPSQTLFQAEVCPVSITAPNSVGMEGGAVTVTVQADADCEWYSDASGRQRGDGEVTFTITAAAAPRTSHFWVAWHDVIIRQGGGACEIRLPGSAYQIGSDGGTIQVPVTTTPECTWLASGGDHVEFSPASGTGSGELRITVKPGEWPTTLYEVTVGDARLTIFQDPITCRRQASFPSELGAGSGVALLTLEAQPGCYVYSYADSDWLRTGGLVQDSPSTSHQLFSYEANTTGVTRVAVVKTPDAVASTRQQPAAAGQALLVEPAAGTGPRQKFRFTFAEPAGETEMSIGKACTIHQRTGFFPFSVDGSCQLNDASVTIVADRFRAVDLDVTVAERGPVAIVAGGRSLGAFLATDRAPEGPRLTAPKPQTGDTGFFIDSDHGYGGTFRMVMEPGNRTAIRTAALTFWSVGPGINACTVQLDVVTRQLSLSTSKGSSTAMVPGTIELGGNGTLESEVCIVKGSGAYMALNPDGSRGVWDVTVLFRSTWTGLRDVWVDLTDSNGGTTRQPEIVYTIDPQVALPSLVVFSDLVRVGISASPGVASARLATGSCMFEYDPAAGLRASTGQPCRLDAARSAAVISGGNLTLVLAYSGDSTGGGQRPLGVEVTPVGGVSSGWFTLGPVPAR